MTTSLALALSFFLLLANAFFVASEFALLAARRSELEEAPSRLAHTTLRAMENITLYMTSAQLGITVCTIGLGAIAEPALAHMVEDVILKTPVPEWASHLGAIFIALAIVVSLHVIIGEMVPKNIAIAKPKQSALLLVWPLKIFTIVLYPAIFILNKSANIILKALGIQAQDEVASSFTREEVSDLIFQSKEAGHLDDLELGLLSGALDFEEKRADSIVISNPRFLDDGARAVEIMEIVKDTGFSRIPLRSEEKSFGEYVHIKDILCHKEVVKRPMLSLNCKTPLRAVVEQMQTSGSHLASVYRGKDFLGIITLEDAQSALVGDIRAFSSK